MLKNAGAKVYRFSLSWARILPRGTLDLVNHAGVEYYNNLINLLLENGITPMITIYHWDLPQYFEETFGGWLSEEMIEHFGNYARFVYGAYGDRVKHWITFNEPWVVCWQGYGLASKAPGIERPWDAPYTCAHTLIKAHARAYRIYQAEFKTVQNGVAGITLDTYWYEPEDPSNPDDVVAAERGLQFHHGWFASPIYFGKYPDSMKEFIDRKSIEEGRNASRLPFFDPAWSLYIRGTADFLGLNHYTTQLCSTEYNATLVGWESDQDIRKSYDPSWPESASAWLRVVPWGFRKLLNWIKETYGNPEVYVTENGFSDRDGTGVNDTERVEYYTGYINNMVKAIVLDECHVTSYTAWSLMDNFEWKRGYTQRFGAHWVDFEDPERPRTPKASVAALRQIYADNGFPDPENKS